MLSNLWNIWENNFVIVFLKLELLSVLVEVVIEYVFMEILLFEKIELCWILLFSVCKFW